MLPQWHVKDPAHSAKSAGGRLQLNIHTPMTKGCRSELTLLSRQSTGTYQGNKLIRKSSGNARPQSSHVAEPLWTDPGLKHGIGVRELISTSGRRKKKRRWGMTSRTFPQSHGKREKKPCSLMCFWVLCPGILLNGRMLGSSIVAFNGNCNGL